MKTWNDYKEYVRTVDPETAKDIKETEEVAAVEVKRSSCVNPHEIKIFSGCPYAVVK